MKKKNVRNVNVKNAKKKSIANVKNNLMQLRKRNANVNVRWRNVWHANAKKVNGVLQKSVPA